MSAMELTDGIPDPATSDDAADDVTIYGTALPTPPPNHTRVLAYGFCYQGHCYRLSMPVEFVIKTAAATLTDPAKGCGYDYAGTTYKSWRLEKLAGATRVERRKGTLEELLLDFNLPGRSPATLTYSAKVGIASKAGKVYE